MPERLSLLALGAALLMGSTVASAGPAPAKALAGVWAGDQHRLTIDALTARLETDCAGGTIAGAILPDGNGRFTASGTYEAYGAGAQPAEPFSRTAAAAQAQYAGEVRQGVLTLSIQTADGARRQITLREGAGVKLRRCL